MPSEFSFPTLLGISFFQLGLNAVRLFFNSILLPLQLEQVLPAAQWISDLEYSPVILISLAFLVTISTLFTLWSIKPYDQPTKMAVSKPLKKEAKETFQTNTQPNGYFWLVLAIFLIYMGIFSLQYFGIYYFEGVIHHSNPAKAMSITGLINLVITMISTLMAHRISKYSGDVT